MLMFIRHAEQVALIVEMHLSLWLDQQEAVNRPAFGLEGDATGNQRVCLLRFGVHPGHNLVLRHRLFCSLHRKTRGEHLRQDNHIATANLFELAIEMAKVGGAVHPN